MFKLSKEEIEDMANQLIKQLEEEDRQLKEFYEHKQNDVMRKAYEYIKDGNNSIDNESILYNPEDYPITSDEFHLLTTNLRNSVPEDEWFIDENNMFPNESIFFEYEETTIELFYMYGQGTAVILRKANEEDSDNSDIKYNTMNPYDE